MVPSQCGGWVLAGKKIVNSTPTATITPIYYTRKLCYSAVLLSCANYTTTLLAPVSLSLLNLSPLSLPLLSVSYI